MTTIAANISESEKSYDVLKRHITALLAMDSAVIIMTLFGNGVFILILAKKRSLHTPSNMLLGALAVSDLLVGIVAQPLWMCELSLVLSRVKVSHMYTITYIAKWAFVFFSILYINVVSLDRYIAVCYPTWYYANATCKSHIIIAVLIFLLSFIGYGVGQALSFRTNNYIAEYIFTVLIALSLLITGFFNFKVFEVIKQQKKQIRRLTFTVDNVQSSQPSHDAYKTLIIPIITVLLFICYTPMIVMEAVWGIFDESKVLETNGTALQYWTEFLILLNSLVNPIVYYARMKAFREAAGLVFCSKRSQTVPA